MATSTIDFNKVIAFSKTHCYSKSNSQCAAFVKQAFQAGGCQYIQGDGWNNQSFCKSNGFQLIGDFYPVGGNPRAHNGMGMQFPAGYKQQVGDICLIQHGQYGHICYAIGPGINDWVSDYFQRPPAQQAGTGPYCYSGGYQRVQFWRHSSVMNGAPVVTEIAPTGMMSNDFFSQQPIGVFAKPSSPIKPQTINSMGEVRKVNMGLFQTLLGTNVIQK